MTIPPITPATGEMSPHYEPARREPNRVSVQWQGTRRFEAGRPGRRVIRIDGDGDVGPSPVDTLLSALATCTAVDVVDILAKRRTPVSTLEIEVEGARADATPRRLTHVLLAFRITGEGIEREQAERAIELSVTKYCSVRDSLDPAIPVEWTLALNDTPRLRTTG